MSSFFIGLSRCGLSLVSGIVNCVPDINISSEIENLENSSESDLCALSIDLQSYTTHGICWLDKLNQLRSLENKFVWVVRNPLDSSCSFIFNYGITAKEALQFWFDINTVIWYFYSSLTVSNRFIIKYENVLLSEKSVVDMFHFLGLKYDQQYRAYGDFDQPTIDCETFNRGRINLERVSPYPNCSFLTEEECNIYRNKPLLKFLNYDISLWE